MVAKPRNECRVKAKVFNCNDMLLRRPRFQWCLITPNLNVQIVNKSKHGQNRVESNNTAYRAVEVGWGRSSLESRPGYVCDINAHCFPVRTAEQSVVEVICSFFL